MGWGFWCGGGREAGEKCERRTKEVCLEISLAFQWEIRNATQVFSFASQPPPICTSCALRAPLTPTQTGSVVAM